MSLTNFGARLNRYPTAEQEFPYKSWREIRDYLTSDDINVIIELFVTIQNNQIIQIPVTVFKIVLKYIVHSCSFEECKGIFGKIQNNYNKTYFISAISSLIRADLIELNPEKNYWVLLKEQEDKWIRNRDERARIADDIISKSYEKYYDEYKNKFGFTYKSPNVDTNNNYGFFLNSISKTLNNEGVEFNLNQPWAKSHQDYSNKIYKERFGESDVPTIYTPKISNIIKDLLTSELKDKYYELQIKYELKRFFY